MERAADALSALLPALESHGVGTWDASEVELLCSMLKEYGAQARGEVASSESLHEEEEEDEEEDEEALFVAAVGTVDQGLHRIRDFLRSRVPYGSLQEPTQVPTAATVREGKANSASKKRARSPEQLPPARVEAPVYAIDSFLYPDDGAVDELVSAKAVSREYCTRCGCTEIELTTFITHSFSQDQLLFLSCFLFPRLLRRYLNAMASQQSVTGEKKHGKAPAPLQPPLSIVDVGSRLGVVLWACGFALQQGALVLPSGADSENDDDSGSDGEEEEEQEEEPEVRIVGVEMDSRYAALSRDVWRRFFAPRRRRAPRLNAAPTGDKKGQASAAKAGQREEEEGEEEPMDVSGNVHIVQSDCFEGDGAAALQAASVVVLHNVFEYFCPSPVEHARCWLKLRRLSKSGQFLVCLPPLAETVTAFSEAEWAQAWAEEMGTTPAPALLTWLASFVEQIAVDKYVDSFLEMRALSQEDGDHHDHHEHKAGGGCCGEQSGEHGGHSHDGHGHTHGEHCGSECSQSGSEQDKEAEELEESLRTISVYRVL